MAVLKKFDTKVQHLKYKILREVARAEWKGELKDKILDIPKLIIKGKEPTMRCCIYKERAIVGEQVKLAIGGNKDNPNVIEVISIACDECPMGGYEVTDLCRGCLAHRCEDVCPRGAIKIDARHKAHIDKSKCVNCGKCAKVCPYAAILNRKRPCEVACKVGAIGTAEDGSALIKNEKCISCGACVYQCPFGAIVDKSFIVDAIDMIKNSNGNKDYKVYAVVAPSISSQFVYAKLGQVITGIQELGFYGVVEAALGADMVADGESKELEEKGELISSCCPAFVTYVQKQFPSLSKYVSTQLSPMAMISKFIKTTQPNAKVVFIGPCTAKKAEFQKENVRPYVDCVITFEELQALFDSKNIDVTVLKETELDNASYFGRIFARCGGLADAVKQGLKEHGSDFELKAVSSSGIEECKLNLLKASKNVLGANFLEGMACTGGCIGGAGCLTHSERDKLIIDKFSEKASEKSITDAISIAVSENE